jgi:hypothetical protein
MGLKAKVIATGKIVDVVEKGNYYDTIDNKERYYGHELDFNDTADYWEKLKHQYAGMAMNALLLTNNIRNGDLEGMRECNTNAMAIAYALVDKLKEKE